MNKVAFIFPGQASQYVGMGRDFFQISTPIRALYQTASDILGYDLARVSFEGPLDKLTETIYTQPAILVHSLAILRELREAANTPAFVAGHSLGEYSALACGGVLSFEEAILAVRERSRAMQAACEAHAGSMAALLGCEGENLEKLVKAAGQEGIIQPANFNSPGQVALSGECTAINKAIELARDFGAKKAIPLQVGGAFHSPLMEPARSKLEIALDNLQFKDARIPVVTNVTAGGETRASRLKELLIKQLTSPVLWRQSIDFLAASGVTHFVEIGPGKVLSGLVKRTVKEAAVDNIDTLEDLQKYLEVMPA